MVGRQVDRDYDGYYGLAQKLGALYVRDGLDAKSAASKAFNDLIGDRYEFRDTWRMPKGGQQPSADDVQAGTVAAKEAIARGGAIAAGAVQPQIASNLDAAKNDMNLTPQEEALYNRHLTNLTGPGGVDNADGSRSTLYQSVQAGPGGRYYNVPTVWDGKRETKKFTRDDGKVFDVPNDKALANIATAGWDSFPSYGTPEEADKRYGQMHGYMDRDVGAYFAQRRPFNIKPALDDMGRGAANEADTMRAIARDGKFVTANDNSGLNLVYADKVVRDRAGKPIELTWAQLAGMGHARSAAQAASPAAAISVAP